MPSVKAQFHHQFGPQHPAAHGRVAPGDGARRRPEIVERVDPHIGLCTRHREADRVKDLTPTYPQAILFRPARLRRSR